MSKAVAKSIFSNKELWNTALSDKQINDLAKRLKIPHYRGAISRDLIHNYPMKNKECFILNIEHSTTSNGTHWIAVIKDRDNIFAFDSYGSTPVKDVLKRYNKFEVVSNDFVLQKMDENIVYCGLISLYVLYSYWKNTHDFYKTVLEIQEDYNKSSLGKFSKD